MLKHRWLNDTVQDRCLYKNYEPVWPLMFGCKVVDEKSLLEAPNRSKWSQLILI